MITENGKPPVFAGGAVNFALCSYQRIEAKRKVHRAYIIYKDARAFFGGPGKGLSIQPRGKRSMKEGYWAIRKYRSGPIGEAIKFWMPGERPSRMTRQIRREIQRASKNSGSQIRTGSRIVNENFGEGDALMGLDYSEEGLEKLKALIPETATEEEAENMLFDLAEHQMELFIRRTMRQMKKDGVELLYFAVTSDRKWLEETGELIPVRIHHHLIVNEEAKEYIMAAWKAGGVDWKPMGAQPDYTGIVAYLLRQVRKVRKDKNAYKSSRNLKRPQAEDRLALSGAELRPPKGAVLLDRGAYQPGQPQYIRYILPNACEEEDLTEQYGVIKASAAIWHKRAEKQKRRALRYGVQKTDGRKNAV